MLGIRQKTDLTWISKCTHAYVERVSNQHKTHAVINVRVDLLVMREIVFYEPRASGYASRIWGSRRKRRLRHPDRIILKPQMFACVHRYLYELGSLRSNMNDTGRRQSTSSE
ncbi:hypothetical protein TNCT_7511 [Trichonephila clavata]|uniref:Uncharacterized protein n=1 Tax=Trichonephila clavata TaxID=2740835 RepID=A0A8X6LK47_TRICU|nr:hypothetical protein TNCT_7511 [Trichonephila clavata]